MTIRARARASSPRSWARWSSSASTGPPSDAGNAMGLAAKRHGRSGDDAREVAYAASHDLRSPIVTISQLVESIQEDFAAELPDEVVRRLVLIRNRADRC